MRVAGAVLLFVAGAATALAAVLLHHLWWGLLLAAAATVAAMVALGRGWLTRLPFALGWVAVVAWMAPQRDEGDFVVVVRPRRLRPPGARALRPGLRGGDSSAAPAGALRRAPRDDS